MLVAGMIRVGGLASVAVLEAGITGAAARGVVVARTISLREAEELHRTSSPALTLDKQGSTSGTIKGTIQHLSGAVTVRSSGNLST
jgi:hypothetical protein